MMVIVQANDTCMCNAILTRVELNIQGELAMKRLITSVVLAVALLTSGLVVTHTGMVGMAYADDGAGE
jgi:hypothetical protein